MAGILAHDKIAPAVFVLYGLIEAVNFYPTLCTSAFITGVSMEIGLVRKIDIDTEMQQAYLDYAMSVIVARALPDARDGLKPVHRRILYAMYDMGLRPDSSYKKSARIVGEVLGKYHPHGDMAVYDSMARMAQDFSMRYLLVDGQGNFGSVDGDPPAAMRYTEARLAIPAVDMLADIGKDTVNFTDNFDGTLQEPDVLPAALPNLLVNGATGIAVGMATSIPPHNLGEVIDALQYLLEKWDHLDDVTVEDLMQFIQGPDFPTGGIILQQTGEEGLAGAYGSGRGRITLQASAHLEEMERGRSRIIVTELPYMTNKASLIERIAELVRGEKIEGIVDLRDESDRQGMRIVIELSKTADPETLLRDLYRHTPMQSTFSINLLALVEGEPRLLSLKSALRVYLDHRLEIVRRRAEYDLEKARQRAHIIEGLRIALQNLDEVIDIIRKAPDVETARARLIKRFTLSEVQASAILDMPLRRLAALERKKIDQEYKELQSLMKELEGLLRSPKKMRAQVGDELLKVKASYNDRRRTHIAQIGTNVSALRNSDLIADQAVWITVTPQGLIARLHGEALPEWDEDSAPAWLERVSSRHTLYLLSKTGEAAALPVHSIPEASSPAQGAPIDRVSALTDNHQLAAVFSLPARADRSEDGYVITTSVGGLVKKSAWADLPGPSANPFTLVKINEGDQVGWACLTDGKSDLFLVSSRGMMIRFSEEEVRPMGLAAAGVMGIKLQEGDQIAGMVALPAGGKIAGGDVFLAASDGSARRTPLDQFPRQGRYGLGIVGWKMPEKARLVGLAVGPGSAHAILHFNLLKARQIRLDEAPLQARSARGAFLQKLKAGEALVRLTGPWESPSLAPASSEKTSSARKSPANKGKAAKAKGPKPK